MEKLEAVVVLKMKAEKTVTTLFMVDEERDCTQFGRECTSGAKITIAGHMKTMEAGE